MILHFKKGAVFIYPQKVIIGKKYLSAGFGYQQIGAFFIFRIQKGAGISQRVPAPFLCLGKNRRNPNGERSKA